MKKFGIIGLILILLLTGCSATSNQEIDFSDYLTKFFNQVPVTSTSNTKNYYSYYLPYNVGRLESTSTSNTFLIQNKQVILNLNIAQIIQDNYYSDLETAADGNAENVITGLYTDSLGNSLSYTFTYFAVSNGQYLIKLDNGDVTFLTVVNYYNAAYILNQIVVMLRSVRVNESLVLSDFSIKNSMVYNNIYQDFFEQVIPTDSTILEMMCSLTGSEQYCGKIEQDGTTD